MGLCVVCYEHGKLDGLSDVAKHKRLGASIEWIDTAHDVQKGVVARIPASYETDDEEIHYIIVYFSTGGRSIDATHADFMDLMAWLHTAHRDDRHIKLGMTRKQVKWVDFYLWYDTPDEQHFTFNAKHKKEALTTLLPT